MDILLVSPDSSTETYQGLSKNYSAIEPPVWALLLAGALQEYEVGILDPLAERLSDHEALIRIANLRPKLLVFVVYGQNPNSGSTNMTGAVRLATYVRESMSIPIAFIGSHPSALPEEVSKFWFVNHVLPGDGLEGIREVMHGSKEKIIWGRPALMSEFKTYPWHMVFPMTNYRSYDWFAGYDEKKRSPYAAIYTSLGCPFKCDFCMINMVNRNSPDQLDAAQASGIRYFPTDFVLRELEHLAKLGVKNVRLSDEMFFLNKQHYLPIVDGLAERRLGLNLWAYARVDTVKPSHLGRFKDAGINWLCLGIESANQTIRREIAKGSYETVDVRQVAKEIREAGINLLANFIFGLPDDSQESMEETLQLALELNAEHTNFYPCMALPGSPLHRYAANEGTPLPTTFSGYSFHSVDCLPLPTKHCSPADVLRFRDEAWERATLDPAHLSLVKEKFGEVAVDHLVKQSKIKLKRNILGT